MPTLESTNKTRNMTLHTDLVPLDVLSSSIDYGRQETPSITVLGKNPCDEHLSGNLQLSPFSNLSSAWQHSENRTVLESGKENAGNADNYSLAWTILSMERISLQSSYKLSSSFSRGPSGTDEGTTRINSLLQSYALSLKPFPILTVNTGFSQEDYQNEISGADRLETRMQIPSCNIIFDPLAWVRFSADYSLKTTTRLTDNSSRRKNNLGITTTFTVFGWGKISHTFEYEHNGGEVTAGGTLPDTDYKKTINSYTLNFNIPQGNPLIESIVLSVSYRLVDYNNLLTGREGDDFKASSIVFDGVLNF
jgi:hypothetical protein